MNPIQNTRTSAKRALPLFGALFLVYASFILLSCEDLAGDNGEDNKGPTTYTVTFNLNDDTRTVDAPEVQTIIAGQTASIPEIVEDITKSPTETVVSWYTEKETTNKFDFTNLITKDITLYAKWSSDFVKITFNLNYDEANPAFFEYAVEKSATTTAPSDLTRENYIVEAWYEKQDLSGTPFDFTNPITKNITLYAKWLNGYRVKFNVNGGSSTVPDALVGRGRMVAKPSVDPIREDYIFGGWYKDNGTAFEFATEIIAGDIALYAVWKGFEPKKSIGMQIPTKSDLKNLSNIPESLQIALEPLADDTAARDYDVVYFTPSGAGVKDGTSWATAYSAAELKKAIDDAAATETKPYLVVIDQGTYSIVATLSMKNNVLIVGGLAASGERSRDQSILDGGGNAQVFSNSGLDSSAVLYGVTMTKGQATSNGGGMANDNASPSLVEVTFSENKADKNGGGMYNYESSPSLVQVTFSENTAGSGGGMYNVIASPSLVQVTFSGNTALHGGGMYNASSSPSSSPSLVQVIFSENTTTNDGGGMLNVSSSPSLVQVIFSKNMASIGGGMYNASALPSLVQVTFSENAAPTGGGIANINNSSPSLVQVTFSKNTADYGGGMYNDNDGISSGPVISSSIFWGNTDTAGTNKSQIYIQNARGTENLSIHNSVIEGAVADFGYEAPPVADAAPANTNIVSSGIVTDDPKLLDKAIDLYLGKSVTIPAIEAGSPAIDMGLYVQKSGSTFYYSEDTSTWYTGFSSTGLSTSAVLPADAIDLTAKDITDYTRINRPDIGAYEFR